MPSWTYFSARTRRSPRLRNLDNGPRQNLARARLGALPDGMLQMDSRFSAELSSDAKGPLMSRCQKL
jgi:hypothetical protein